MQNRPAAADAGLSAGVINTNTRSTKYRPHSLAYKTSACNAKICGGEEFTTLFQIRTHGNMRSYRKADVLRRECLSSFVVRFAYLKPVRLWPCRCAFYLHAYHCAAYMYAWGDSMHTSANIRSRGWYLHGRPDAPMRCNFLYTMPLRIVQTSTEAKSLHPSEPLQCANNHWVSCIGVNDVVNMGSGKGYHTQ